MDRSEATSLPPTPSPEADPGWRVWPLVLVLVGLIGGGSVLGVFAFRSYARSELALRVLYREAGEAGARLDGDGCVGWALAAQKRCTAMQSLCQGALPGLVERCLGARERRDQCVALGQTADTHWSRARCASRGLDPRNRGCAIAYLALAAYCQRLDGEVAR